METEFTFRVAFASLLLAAGMVRCYYHVKAGTPREPLIGEREPYNEGVRRIIWGWILTASFVLFIFFPERLHWSSLPLPDAVRWIGFGMGILGLLLLTWVQHSLGRSFSATLRIRRDQNLVVTGPYRTVRHPMYTALLLLWGGLAILSANWFILLQVLAGVSGIIRVRAPLEEAMMLEVFGDSYREYMKRTGRFLPRWQSQRGFTSCLHTNKER
jgi:protein-S-isoprenylcysteine O-methyltransferase Ste14